MSEVTHILDRVQQGGSKAAEELLPLVYEELHRLAAQKMAHEVAGHTLQPTALVHEAWLRLVGDEPQRWNGRGHFFGAVEALNLPLESKRVEKGSGVFSDIVRSELTFVSCRQGCLNPSG